MFRKGATKGRQDPSSLRVTLQHSPGCPRGLQRVPHLHFKTTSVNNNNLVLTLIYQSMTLAVVTTKLNQTMREQQNSKGCHFNIKGSVTLKNRIKTDLKHLHKVKGFWSLKTGGNFNTLWGQKMQSLITCGSDPGGGCWFRQWPEELSNEGTQILPGVWSAWPPPSLTHGVPDRASRHGAQ